MSQKTYLAILRSGIYFSLICVFFVFKGLLFPYITSKQIPFNIIMEILLIFWIAFLVKYPEYRPKRSWITWGMISFFVVMVISCFTGVDFNLSFWGDVERMLGAFHILHFFIFYLIAITAFREWKDWKMLLIASVVCGIFVSFYGLGEGRMGYSTIGNSAYVSGYLIFNMFFCVLLFFKEKIRELKWLYLVPLPLFFAHFDKLSTSGAHVGLGFSILVALFLYGILNNNKKLRMATLLICFISVISVSWLFMHKDSAILNETPGLKAIRGIDFQKRTFQTRLISWRAGLKDFKEHPFIGVGHGNYAIIFDKYFTPDFYLQTRGETYFDRAHNNVVDIASTTGVFGISTYLLIFLAAGFYLVDGYRKRYIGLHDFVLVSCLIIAYFVQNLAVFDSFITYMCIMIVLAYVYWMRKEGEESLLEEIEEGGRRMIHKVTKDTGFDNKEIYALVIAGFILSGIMYQYNIMPWKMLNGTIDGQRAYSAGKVPETLAIYKKALSYDTVLDRDSRTSLIRVFANNINALNNLNKETVGDDIDYLIKIAEENVKYNEGDSLNQMTLAQILNTASAYYANNREKFMYYSDRALEAIDKAIAASPGRSPVYFQKAQVYITRNEGDKAIEVLKQAAALNDKYYDSFCHLGKTQLHYGYTEEAYENIDKCIDLGGFELLTPSGYVKELINHYVDLEDWNRVIQLYEKLSALEPGDVKHLINLAKLYAQQGEQEKAIGAVDRAVKADPSLEAYADSFIDSLIK